MYAIPPPPLHIKSFPLRDYSGKMRGLLEKRESHVECRYTKR